MQVHPEEQGAAGQVVFPSEEGEVLHVLGKMNRQLHIVLRESSHSFIP